MKLYFWSSLIALLLHSSCSARIDSDYASGERQPRQTSYRGNYRFQVPQYLNPENNARTIYSTDRRGAPDGSFGYEYHTDNGISAKQESDGYGANKVVRGYYSYVGSDGITYTVNYIADRFGYRAYGAHLPTQPDAIYDQTKFPVYRPTVNNPYYGAVTPAPAVYPINNQNYQHETQQAYYPQSLASQPIYVTEQPPANYISITPKPIGNRYPSTTQLPVSILPPYNNNYVQNSGQYSPYAWTTAKPVYNGGFAATTVRPYVSY